MAETHEWLTEIEIERTRQLMRLFEIDKPPALEAGGVTMLRLLADLDVAKGLLRECAERMEDFIEYSMGFECDKETSLLTRIRAVPGVEAGKEA